MKEYQYILTYGATIETLGYNPAGWDKLGITFLRHEFYHSVLRSFTLLLRFTNISRGGLTGGYQLIKLAYDTDGIHAEVSVEIKKRNPNTNDYDSLYTGVLDFTPGRWTIDRDLFFEIAINDSSILQKFISRDENEINVLAALDLDGNVITALTPSTIYLTPVDILVRTRATVSMVDSFSLGTPFQGFVFLDNPTYSIQELSGTNIIGAQKVYTNEEGAAFNIITNLQSNISVEGILGSGTVSGYAIVTTTIKYYTSGDTLLFTDYLGTQQIDINLGQFIYLSSESITVNHSLPSNGYINIGLFITIVGASEDAGFTIDHTVDYTLTITKVVPGIAETSADCIYPEPAFNKSIEILTGEENLIDSYLIESGGDLEFDAIFNGRQVRKFPRTNLPLNIKFRDLFKSFDSLRNIGIGFSYTTNRFYMLPKASFFDSSTELFDLGEVSKFKIQSYQQAYFSKVEAGYDNDGKYERIAGGVDFNVKREYSTIAKVKDTKNIRCPWRADSVGIEDLRSMLYIDASTQDDNADNDIFIVRTVSSHPILPTGAQLQYLGMDMFYSYYNTMITPRANAIRYGDILKACHYKKTNNLQPQRTEKVFELVVGAGDENTYITLPTALFIPELYSFENYLTPTNLAILLNNPHGYIRFIYKGVAYQGFVNKIELGDYNTKASFELISMDMSIDIRTFEDGSLHLFEDGTQKLGE